MDRRPVGKPWQIVLAVDGSEHSWAAVDLLQGLPLSSPVRGWAASAAGQPGRQVCVAVVAVMLPREASQYANRMSVLEKTRNLLEGKGYQVTTELLVGRPSEMLVEYARENRPDLFVLGAQGLRASLEILLGGVAQHLVEYAEWPVLVVRAPFTGLRRVLAAVDGSSCSLCALESLGIFPLPEDCRVEIIHVLPPPLPPGMAAHHFPPIPEAYAALSVNDVNMQAREEDEERDGWSILHRSAEILQASGFEPELVLRRGDEATEIIDYARANQVNLLVSGSRGLNSLRSILLGSVSRKLVHYSGCSTLVVKGEAS